MQALLSHSGNAAHTAARRACGPEGHGCEKAVERPRHRLFTRRTRSSQRNMHSIQGAPPPRAQGGNGHATHTGIKATMNDVGKERRNNDAGRSDKTPPLRPNARKRGQKSVFGDAGSVLHVRRDSSGTMPERQCSPSLRGCLFREKGASYGIINMPCSVLHDRFVRNRLR